MLFENLRTEMWKRGISMIDMSKNKKLNLSYESIRNKFAQKTEWTRKEMFVIQQEYFPDKTLEYLFN